MSPEVIAIVTVGVSLAALILSGHRSLRADLRTGLAAASAERVAIRNDLHALAKRVARLEGAFPFIARSASAPPPAAPELRTSD